MNHDKMYSTALAVLGAMAAFSAGLLLFLAGASMGGSINAPIPDASLSWVAAANGSYALAIVFVLCARHFRSKSGRELTRLLNWALLPAFPGGTVVGIYGLWKADKAPFRAPQKIE